MCELNRTMPQTKPELQARHMFEGCKPEPSKTSFRSVDRPRCTLSEPSQSLFLPWGWGGLGEGDFLPFLLIWAVGCVPAGWANLGRLHVVVLEVRPPREGTDEKPMPTEIRLHACSS